MILRSKLEKAKEFKRWVTSEVLPSIRKYGQYRFQEQIRLLTQEKDLVAKQLLTVTRNHNNILRRRKRDLYEIGNVVYIVSHEAFTQFYKDNYHKIGIATQTKTESQAAFTGRLSTYNTGAPGNYNVHYLMYIEENKLVEDILKLKFKDNIEPGNKEWIKTVKLEDIIEFIKKICDLIGISYKEHDIPNYYPITEDNEQIDKEVYDESEYSEDVDESEQEQEVEYEVEEDSEYSDEGDDDSGEEKEDSEYSEEGDDESGEEKEEYKLLKRVSGDIKSITLTELREMCKKYGLFYTGNKPELVARLKLYLETGERKRNAIEKERSNEVTCDAVEDEKEKKLVLENLDKYTYDKLKIVCRKYGIQQRGTCSELSKKIRDYLEKGEKHSLRRKDVYKYDSGGKLIKHWQTVTEAVEECGLNKNIIANALDQMYSVNGFIWRSRNVRFTKQELEEISSKDKKSKKQLTKDDHDVIRRRYKDGEDKKKLMNEYGVSMTQIRRILI